MGIVDSSLLLLAALASPGLAWQQTRSREALEHYSAASRLYLKGNYARVVEELKVSLQLDPGQLRATRLLGITYQLLGRLPDAESAFRQAIRLSAKDSESWFYLGRVCYEQNFFDRAVEALRQALLLKPSDIRAREYLALTLVATGDTDGAVRECNVGLREADRDRQHSWSLHLTYGILLHKLNRLAESESQLRRSRELNPNHWRVWFELGKLHLETGRSDAAVENFMAALRTGTAKAEETVRIYRLLGRAYYALGHEEAAREALAEAEKFGP